MKKIFFILLVIPFVAFSQTDVYMIYGQGIQSFYKKNFDEAIYYFNQSIELKPDFMLAFYYRGLANYNSSRTEKALDDFNSAIAIDSTYKDAYLTRAETLLSLKRYPEASSAYESLIVKNPGFHLLYKQLGLCYYYMRKYELSDIAYSNYLAKVNDDYETHFKRGMANFYGSNYKQAIEDFTLVLDLKPEYLSALDMRAQSYQKYNMIDKACIDWKEAIIKGYTYSIENKAKFCVE